MKKIIMIGILGISALYACPGKKECGCNISEDKKEYVCNINTEEKHTCGMAECKQEKKENKEVGK